MSSPPERILVIEDETSIRRFLRASLSDRGFSVVEAGSGRDALALASSEPPDLVILDLGLPDMEGLEIIDRLRDWSQVPILVLSARGKESDKVAALDRGADDYLTKPFGIGELLARVRVALRHAARASAAAGEPVFRIGDLAVDLAARRVHLANEEIHLTPLEYRLLSTFVQNAGKVLTHRQLLHQVWGPGHGDNTHYVRVFVAGLRRKLETNPARPRYLFTEPGVGYRFADE